MNIVAILKQLVPSDVILWCKHTLKQALQGTDINSKLLMVTELRQFLIIKLKSNT